MNILILKIGAFFAILLTGLGGGFLSLNLGLSKNSEKNFSLCNAFAGGIFFGAGLIHMLPDAQEGFSDFIPEYASLLATFLCACGFILILFLEKVLMREHNISKIFGKGNSEKTLYPYILGLVLSIHSIIAGIALGTEETIKMGVVILIALLAHKGSAAFALGVSLLRTGITRKGTMKIISFFCIMTPLGIIVGSLLTTFLTGKIEQLFTGIFDGMAGGTFLYVALIDIIHEEFGKPENKWLKFILLLAGLILMAILALWT